MTRKLGRKIGSRKSLMRNLAASLVLFEKVDTTEAKAKELKAVVEHLISISKKQNLASYRQLLAYFYDENAAKKVYVELSKRYENRPSGYLHLYHIGNRLGDNSKMVRLELIDRKVFAPVKKEKAKTEEVKTDKEIKADKKAEKRMEKLSQVQQKSGVVTQIRTKAARKTGTSN
ncbi:MAG: 50S ribosomal protein L17 [Patescibacteria group bacterium]